MANVNGPFGLKPVRYKGGSPYTGACTLYYVASNYGTALFIGDPVVKTGTANTAAFSGPGIGKMNIGTVQEVAKAAAGDATRVTGAIVGFVANPADLTMKHNPATSGVTRGVWVADDPDILFEIQANGAVTAATMGLNAIFIYTQTGSTITGLSGVELDTTGTAPSADASNQMLIVAAANREDNDTTLTRAKVLVKLVNHTEADGNTANGDGILGI